MNPCLNSLGQNTSNGCEFYAVEMAWSVPDAFLQEFQTGASFLSPMTPDPANEMFGRSGFLIHGDSLMHPGCASRGCIVLARPSREAIAQSGDQDLEVVD